MSLHWNSVLVTLVTSNGGESAAWSAWRGHITGCLLIMCIVQSQFQIPPQFQLPSGFPWWQPPQQQQHAPKISLTPFCPSNPAAWFRLAEATFNCLNVHDVRLRFDFVLPDLPESALTQLWDILRTADVLQDPYEALKAELIRQFSPNMNKQLNKLIFSPELGGQAPTQLMRNLLVCLPAGEPPGLLFKHLFLLKLPSDLRDQVAKKMERLDARELAEYADKRWHVRNSKKGPGKVVVAVEAAEVSDNESDDLLTGAVAAVPPGRGGDKKKKPQGRPSVQPVANKQPAT